MKMHLHDLPSPKPKGLGTTQPSNPVFEGGHNLLAWIARRRTVEQREVPMNMDESRRADPRSGSEHPNVPTRLSQSRASYKTNGQSTAEEKLKLGRRRTRHRLLSTHPNSAHHPISQGDAFKKVMVPRTPLPPPTGVRVFTRGAGGG